MSGQAVTSFEDLVAWQRARALVREVFAATAQPPLAQRFGFRDQLERAAVSVMSNIAEGFERGSRAEFHHFLSIAKGSCAEVRSLLYAGHDANLLSLAAFERLISIATETSRVIGGLRASVGRQRNNPPPP
ncbi:MAG: four helix bundle protein [Dehalococcoidia bacterium]